MTDKAEKKQKTAVKKAPIRSLGEQRLKLLSEMKRQGLRPLKIDDQGYYQRYYVPERCVVCGRNDLGLNRRIAGFKCIDCLGLSAQPVLVDDMTFAYNPNRFLHVPKHLVEEIHRHPYRTTRFLQGESNVSADGSALSALHPEVRFPLNAHTVTPNRTFNRYPAAAVPSSVAPAFTSVEAPEKQPLVYAPQYVAAFPPQAQYVAAFPPQAVAAPTFTTVAAAPYAAYAPAVATGTYLAPSHVVPTFQAPTVTGAYPTL